MPLDPVGQLRLESLADRIPVITEEAVGYYKQNCMVCFHRNGHKSGVRLITHHLGSNDIWEVFWLGDVTEQLLKNYPRVPRVTEDAACAIALLFIRECTDFTGIEMSVLGTSIDYYLAPKNQDQDIDLLFNHTARLEASGILEENENNTVEKRINDKLNRLKLEGNLPTYIVVVEFSKPWSKMVQA